MNFTTTEAEQYARMTFKQFGLSCSLVFQKNLTRRLGQANPWKNRVELSFQTLSCFPLFKKTLYHECIHMIQYVRMGNTYKVNGRNQFHGKIFKEICREYGVSPSTTIP